MILSAHGQHSEQQLIILGTPDVPIYLLSHRHGYALIEGGIAALAPQVLRQLTEYVGDLSLVSHWFITHAHYDHCGLLPYLYAHLPKVKIYVSSETARAFHSERATAMIDKLNGQLSSPEDMQFLETNKTPFNELPLQLLQDQDVVNLDENRCLRVLATSGHAPCLMSFFDTATHTAFVSDALGEFIKAGHWCPLIFDDVTLYRQSIAKIQALKPKAIALAHHALLTGDDANAATFDALEAINEFTRLAERFFTEENNLQKTAERLSDYFYASSRDFVPAQLHYQSMLFMLKQLLPSET